MSFRETGGTGHPYYSTKTLDPLISLHNTYQGATQNTFQKCIIPRILKKVNTLFSSIIALHYRKIKFFSRKNFIWVLQKCITGRKQTESSVFSVTRNHTCQYNQLISMAKVFLFYSVHILYLIILPAIFLTARIAFGSTSFNLNFSSTNQFPRLVLDSLVSLNTLLVLHDNLTNYNFNDY